MKHRIIVSLHDVMTFWILFWGSHSLVPARLVARLPLPQSVAKKVTRSKAPHAMQLQQWQHCDDSTGVIGLLAQRHERNVKKSRQC